MSQRRPIFPIIASIMKINARDTLLATSKEETGTPGVPPKERNGRALEEAHLLECEGLDSIKNNENRRHPLSSGIPCTDHKCVKCCIETRMPLSRSDVDRISKQGYKFKDFVVKRGKERHLRNRDGRCVFLGEDSCVIYSFRPEGCQLYPLVFNENTRKVGIHELCPYGHEFEVGRDDVEKLTVLLNKLSTKRN